MSIDSLNPKTLAQTGRTTPTGPMTGEEYLHVIRMLKERQIGTKINTVVTMDNLGEDPTPFIISAGPERWKILQVLPMAGQNDLLVDQHIIGRAEFGDYVRTAAVVEGYGIKLVPENNDLTTGSYVMVDPAGRFFDNAKGRHSYSEPILEVGAERALSQLSVDAAKFIARGGRYNSENRRTP